MRGAEEDVSALLENAEAEYLFERVSALAEMPGNPYGAAVFDRLEERSFLVADSQSPMNNRICGFDLESEGLPDRMGCFASVGARAHLPVIGAPKDIKERAEALGLQALRGWTHGQFSADLADIAESSGCARRLAADELEVFVEIHAGAFRYSGARMKLALDMMRGLLAAGRAEAYAVDVDNAVAAIGLVYFATNGTAYLATAATARAARKRGAHAALISRRIEAARARGCRRVSSTALVSSQSARNLKRAGLARSHVQTLLVLR